MQFVVNCDLKPRAGAITWNSLIVINPPTPIARTLSPTENVAWFYRGVVLNPSPHRVDSWLGRSGPGMPGSFRPQLHRTCVLVCGIIYIKYEAYNHTSPTFTVPLHPNIISCFFSIRFSLGVSFSFEVKPQTTFCCMIFFMRALTGLPCYQCSHKGFTEWPSTSNLTRLSYSSLV